MSVSYIGVVLRRLVVARADSLCEYCLIHELDSFFGHAADHIISEKHGGPTEADNLAYACVTCNQAKGSDIGSIHWPTGQFVRLFNPRTDQWPDHFVLDGIRIEPLTPIGDVTVRLLAFNSSERLLEREVLAALNRYPSLAALRRISP